MEFRPYLRAAGKVLVDGIVFASILFALFFFGYRGQDLAEQRLQEALLSAQLQAAEGVEALICTLAAPLEEGPYGNTIRDEGFVNHVCLAPHGVDPFDVDGDGIIDTSPPAREGTGGNNGGDS